MEKRTLKRVIYSIMAPVCIGAVLYILWCNGAFLPQWIAWENERIYDASGQYEIMLAHKKVNVRWNDGVIWTSPKGLVVQQAISVDIDNDRQDELILLCWRIGRYGKSKPFWVEQNEREWSQHIVVYEYDGDKMKKKWMSSYIGQYVADMAAADKITYVTEREEAEGEESKEALSENTMKHPDNKLFLTDLDGMVSRWFWDSWGFTKEETEVSFVVFGDNLIHEPIYQYGLHNDEKFEFLFENMRNVIEESDIAVINQETPLTDAPAKYSDYPRFDTPVQVGEAIAAVGFDVVTCATNHALDQGMSGINFTKNFFDSYDIKCLGIQSEDEKEYHSYDIIVRNGIRIAMLNYTYGTNEIKVPEKHPHAVHLLEDEKQIRDDIEEAKADSDFVIVFSHWGTEYDEQPDDFQKKWTQIFAECGVDVVVGTHPHVLQPYEVLQTDDGCEMLVYYSIGNYISAQSEKSCVKGGMASFTVSLTSDGYRITEYGLQPLTITWQEGRKCVVNF